MPLTRPLTAPETRLAIVGGSGSQRRWVVEYRWETSVKMDLIVFTKRLRWLDERE